MIVLVIYRFITNYSKIYQLKTINFYYLIASVSQELGSDLSGVVLAQGLEIKILITAVVIWCLLDWGWRVYLQDGSFAFKLNSNGEVEKIPEKWDFLKLMQEEKENLGSPVFLKETEIVFYTPPTKDGFSGERVLVFSKFLQSNRG